MDSQPFVALVLTVFLIGTLEAGRKPGDWTQVETETEKGTLLYITLKSGEKLVGVFLGSDADYIDTVWQRRSRDILKTDIKKVERARENCGTGVLMAPITGPLLALMLGGPVAKINRTAGISVGGAVLGAVAAGVVKCVTKKTLYGAP